MYFQKECRRTSKIVDYSLLDIQGRKVTGKFFKKYLHVEKVKKKQKGSRIKKRRNLGKLEWRI